MAQSLLSKQVNLLSVVFSICLLGYRFKKKKRAECYEKRRHKKGLWYSGYSRSLGEQHLGHTLAPPLVTSMALVLTYARPNSTLKPTNDTAKELL